MKNPLLGGSDVLLWREIVEDCGCGLLLDPHDAKGIAHAIEYLLTHSEEAQQMGSCGPEAIERHYNWNTEERQLLALYNSPCCRPTRHDSQKSRAARGVRTTVYLGVYGRNLSSGASLGR